MTNGLLAICPAGLSLRSISKNSTEFLSNHGSPPIILHSSLKKGLEAPFLVMVGEIGFEPTTLWSQTRCATRLRYSPTY